MNQSEPNGFDEEPSTGDLIARIKRILEEDDPNITVEEILPTPPKDTTD